MFLFNPADYPVHIQRQGVLYTTPAQAHILKWLYDPAARATEQPFKVIDLKALGLPHQAKPTVTRLMERDWIIESTKAFAETRYQITSRGIKAMKLINQSAPKHHADALCSNCRQRPRKQYPSRLHTYCHECILEKQRKTRQFKGHQHDPNKLCSRCQTHKRQVARNGNVDVYCRPCRNEMYRKQADSQFQQVQSTGNTKICCDCHQAQVHVTKGRVYRRCETCQKRVWANEYVRQKAAGKR